MIKRTALLALFALTACAPQEAAEDGMAKSSAPAALEEPMVAPAPEAARDSALPEECTGDGIGGTGCPDL